MHTLDIPQRITRSAQRVGHSVRRNLPDRYEHGHWTLLFIFQTTVPQVSRHADDFEIALLVLERDAPAHRILVPEVSPRQPLADHCNRRGARLVVLVNLTPGQDRNLHGREETRSGDHDACALDGNSADPHCPPVCPPPARPALMIEDCESVALLTPGIDSKRLRRSA